MINRTASNICWVQDKIRNLVLGLDPTFLLFSSQFCFLERVLMRMHVETIPHVYPSHLGGAPGAVLDRGVTPAIESVLKGTDAWVRLCR